MYKSVFQHVIHIKITETPDILFLAKSSAAGVYCTLTGHLHLDRISSTQWPYMASGCGTGQHTFSVLVIGGAQWVTGLANEV